MDKNTGQGIYTSAGESAGIEMTSALVTDLDGEHVAENAACSSGTTASRTRPTTL